MAGVSVSGETVLKQAKMLHQTSKDIEQAVKYLSERFQSLGTGWSDEKYRALGNTVIESVTALKKLQVIFQHGEDKLIELYDTITAYEDINVSGGGTASSPRYMTKDEVDNAWRSAVESIDEQIENCRMALHDRGVPDCKWLDSVLAHHRAAMLEQEGYELDAASGHREDSINDPQAYRYSGDPSQLYDSIAQAFRTHCLEGTNPNYEKEPCWTDNCQRCVPACESRRRGNDVTARPSSYGSIHLEYRPFDVWRDADVQTCRENGRSEIESAMSGWGDGARAQVVVYWDTPLGGGHTFLAEQLDGRTVFSDPQTGCSDVSEYFDRVIPGETQFCRIDNLQFSSYMEECCQEVSDD